MSDPDYRCFCSCCCCGPDRSDDARLECTCKRWRGSFDEWTDPHALALALEVLDPVQAAVFREAHRVALRAVQGRE